MKQIPDAEWRSLCAELRPDDGVPPHVLKKQESARADRSSGGHRGRQYCKAVQRCLEGALEDGSADPSLTGLTIHSVSEESGRAVLLVIALQPDAESGSLTDREAKLNAAAGRLRAAIAGATHRKRVPHLRFRVLPASSGG